MITLKRLHVLMPSITFPIDPRHLPSGRACSRLAGGCSSPTLAVTGPLTSEELATRSSVGLLLFVPEGYDKEVIAQSGLRLLVCKNLTTNMAEVAEKRRAAPEKDALPSSRSKATGHSPRSRTSWRWWLVGPELQFRLTSAASAQNQPGRPSRSPSGRAAYQAPPLEHGSGSPKPSDSRISWPRRRPSRQRRQRQFRPFEDAVHSCRVRKHADRV